jgi:hypothetical protein
MRTSAVLGLRHSGRLCPSIGGRKKRRTKRVRGE